MLVLVLDVDAVDFDLDAEELDCKERKDAFDFTECTEPTVDTDPASLQLSSPSSSLRDLLRRLVEGVDGD